MGGTFSLLSSSINDRQSIHRDNGAVKGGAIYCKSCSLDILNIQYLNNQAYKGGTFFIEDYSGSFVSDLITVT